MTKQNDSAARFASEPHSNDHSALRETAWLGGHLAEARYIVGVLTGENLFELDTDAFYKALHVFISNQFSADAANIFCNGWGADLLLPYLRATYSSKPELPPFPPPDRLGPPRNERVERATFFLLQNLHVEYDEIAEHLGTTEKQVLRLSNVTHAKRLINQYFATQES